MSVRLSADRDRISDEAIQKARELFFVPAAVSVEEHNRKVDQAKNRYGVAVWFSAVEIARQELTNGGEQHEHTQ